MKSTLRRAALGLALAVPLPANAADDMRSFPIRPVVDWVGNQRKLDPSIRLYFRAEPTPVVLQKLGPVAHTQRAVKTDGEPCAHVLMAGLLAMQAKARQLGGNAVFDIVSAHKGRDTAEAGRYE